MGCRESLNRCDTADSNVEKRAQATLHFSADKRQSRRSRWLRRRIRHYYGVQTTYRPPRSPPHTNHRSIVECKAGKDDGRFSNEESHTSQSNSFAAASTCSSRQTMSTSSSDLSGALTEANGDVKAPKERHARNRKAGAHDTQYASARDVLLFLVGFRILNALTIRTFFQPDEYFQSLEPAWHMVFGRDSGAWITWVSLAVFCDAGDIH